MTGVPQTCFRRRWSGLAVHFARLNRDRFPDGLFGVDLREAKDPLALFTRRSSMRVGWKSSTSSRI